MKRTHQRQLAAATAAGFFSCQGCGGAPPPPPVTMGIAVPEQCYHAEATGTNITFELRSLTTPGLTDGVIEVIVSDPQDRFAPLSKEVSVQLGPTTPRDVLFAAVIPDSASASGPVHLTLHAEAGPDTYTGVVKKPCL